MKKPNVILVITDDQGYGDLGCTGNRTILTPNIDRFHDESVRLADFHVSPLCTPTRAGLLSGRNPLRNGAWATCWGRSILRKNEVTMADVFAATGYRTGMFGKWHLGDNYPYRPQDRGFQTVVAHKGGGVGQTPDFWGNNYFNDTYFHNGKPVGHEGYCTDIWFEEAARFIEADPGSPFFCYIATNAPHAPYLVADRYRQLYQNREDIPEPAFHGMITNIDENFGRLSAKLREWGLAEDTILVFMTDNGSSGGCTLKKDQFVDRGFNAGMRGKKGSYYDGGHRVPFFLRWPKGELGGGLDIHELVTHLDVLPTLIDLCGLDAPEDVVFDGVSAANLLRGDASDGTAMPERCVHVQYHQGTEPPAKWENAVLNGRWRLVYGKELYDVPLDPGQERDVSALYPGIVQRLREAHETWWDEVSPLLNKYCPISLGNDAENPTRLDAMDVMGDVAWNQCHIARAQKSAGRWTVDVERAGDYTFSLRRWPRELGLPMDETVAADEAKRLAPYERSVTRDTFRPVRARLKLFDHEATVDVAPGMKEVSFNLELRSTGVTTLAACFVDDKEEEHGAYYVYVTRA